MSVKYHEGRFPPAILNWPKLIPCLNPSAAVEARGRKASVLCFPELLNIAEGRPVF